MLITAPSGMLLWLFSVLCSGSRLSDWLMQCVFTGNFLDVFVCGNIIFLAPLLCLTLAVLLAASVLADRMVY